MAAGIHGMFGKDYEWTPEMEGAEWAETGTPSGQNGAPEI